MARLTQEQWRTVVTMLAETQEQIAAMAVELLELQVRVSNVRTHLGLPPDPADDDADPDDTPLAPVPADPVAAVVLAADYPDTTRD